MDQPPKFFIIFSFYGNSKTRRKSKMLCNYFPVTAQHEENKTKKKSSDIFEQLVA